MDKYEIVGSFSERVVSLLQLDVAAGTPILLSTETRRHFTDGHADAFGPYGHLIGKVITHADLCGVRPTDGTVEFVKLLPDNSALCLNLAVRPSSKQEYFVRTLHLCRIKRIEQYERRGRLFRLTDQ